MNKAMTESGKQYKILLVDDDADILALISTWLKNEDFTVITSTSGEEAITQVGIVRPDLVITDLFMGGMDGMQLLSEIHQDNPLLPVIMLSGQAQIPDAVRATHLGSAAFLTKPVKKEELIEQARKALRISGDNAVREDMDKRIIYRSKEMVQLVELAKLVAENDVTVFISGATGTGKEVFARVIHDASRRKDHPFIADNCGAIPEQLLESELFGHEKGAFTGANTRHEGLFQAASGGTIFLDEIGDMPLSLQVKLLRVLQDLQVRPVGSTKSYPIDVRIISATHRNLEEAVKKGEFREDLYYRLKVVPIEIPDLAHRRDDIPVLIEHLLAESAKRTGQKKKRFAPEAMDHLVAASWPGNIRQLMNVVDLCVTLCKTSTIPASLARTAMQDKPGPMQTLKEAKQAFERNYLISVLRVTSGHVANAARIAGRNRTEFYKLLNQHNIDPTQFRSGKSSKIREEEE